MNTKFYVRLNEVGNCIEKKITSIEKVKINKKNWYPETNLIDYTNDEIFF